MSTTPHPDVVSHDKWLAERKHLLAEEKELTRHGDRVNALRRRLPMVKLTKHYEFDTTNGRKSLQDLFDGRRQLIVYHFMFDPTWEKGCSGCTGLINALGDLSMLTKRDTTFAVVSRAPLAKLQRYRHEQGWNIDWYSSFGGDFNYDYHVTLDPAVAPVQYNFCDEEELSMRKAAAPGLLRGEAHGLSVFFRMQAEVFHTYSTYARGCENVTNAYELLDRTPYGRQEDFEDSPAGWPQKPTYG